MKKILILIFCTIFIISCTDEQKRMEDCKSKFPGKIVEPATGMLQQEGYEFIVIDTSSLQIIAIKYRPFSEKAISLMRNIR
jgi:hypothetical protein